MYDQDDALSDELHGYGRAISKVLADLLAETAVEGATMYEELSFKRIARRFKEE
jgi:hypothetical protein